MTSFIPETVIIKPQRNKPRMRLVASTKDRQKLANQPETNKYLDGNGWILFRVQILTSSATTGKPQES